MVYPGVMTLKLLNGHQQFAYQGQLYKYALPIKRYWLVRKTNRCIKTTNTKSTLYTPPTIHTNRLSIHYYHLIWIWSAVFSQVNLNFILPIKLIFTRLTTADLVKASGTLKWTVKIILFSLIHTLTIQATVLSITLHLG